MDFMTLPMFDILNIQTLKVKMSMYLKALGIHVYFATTKNHYCLNGKNFEANAKAIHALKSTLNDDYLSRFSNICLLYTSPSPRDRQKSRMPSSA